MLGTTFRSFAIKMSGFNSAVSYGLQNGITGTYPAYDINYPLLLVSRGDLPNAANPKAVATTGSNVTYTWSDNSGAGKAAATDKAILVVYCPFFNQAVYTLDGGSRSDESSVLNVSVFSGQAVETWFAFITADGKDTATSIYTGHLTIS